MLTVKIAPEPLVQLIVKFIDQFYDTECKLLRNYDQVSYTKIRNKNEYYCLTFYSYKYGFKCEYQEKTEDCCNYDLNEATAKSLYGIIRVGEGRWTCRKNLITVFFEKIHFLLELSLVL